MKASRKQIWNPFDMPRRSSSVDYYIDTYTAAGILLLALLLLLLPQVDLKTRRRGVGITLSGLLCGSGDAEEDG